MTAAVAIMLAVVFGIVAGAAGGAVGVGLTLWWLGRTVLPRLLLADIRAHAVDSAQHPEETEHG